MDGDHFATQHGIVNLLTKYAASMVFPKSLTLRKVIVTSVPWTKMLTRRTVITFRRSYQPATTRKPLLYAKVNHHLVSTLCINEVALKERMNERKKERMNERMKKETDQRNEWMNEWISDIPSSCILLWRVYDSKECLKFRLREWMKCNERTNEWINSTCVCRNSWQLTIPQVTHALICNLQMEIK